VLILTSCCRTLYLIKYCILDVVYDSGGYIVFDTMEKLAPDFAVFQGDMVYGDNAIPAIKDYKNGTGEVIGTWYNNPTKDFVAVTLDDFR